MILYLLEANLAVFNSVGTSVERFGIIEAVCDRRPDLIRLDPFRNLSSSRGLLQWQIRCVECARSVRFSRRGPNRIPRPQAGALLTSGEESRTAHRNFHQPIPDNQDASIVGPT